jgi:hypothetical protein
VTGVVQTIARLEEIGGRLALAGERILYSVPRGDTEVQSLLGNLREHREEVRELLRQRAVTVELGPREELAMCGSPYCDGCYDVGRGAWIHPPKCGKQYQVWLERWQAKGKAQ